MGFEVGVVGGGAIGLACAWRLAQRGVTVALFESAATGGGATQAAGGMLAAQCEAAGHPPRASAAANPSDGASGGASAEHDEFFRACLHSRSLYPEFARELEHECGIDIELSQRQSLTSDWRRPGILFIADHAHRQESEQIALRFEQQQQFSSVEPRKFANSEGAQAFWLEDEGQVENRLLARALRLACEKVGVSIFERAQIDHQEGTWTCAGEPLGCEQVLVCAGAWSGTLWSNLSRPLYGQMIVLEAKRAVEYIHYGSRAYLVPRRDGRLLVGATEEERGFDTTSRAGGIRQLLDAALEMLPQLSECKLLDHWAGLRPASPDGLPSIGQLDETSWCATGHGRNGILLCPWTAQAIVSAMLDHQPAPSVFDPQRFSTPFYPGRPHRI